ncbi:hypothetical protein A2154_02340, partial [Candidatus Gottesmanbacteria bacterium RBG_16_43_7]
MLAFISFIVYMIFFYIFWVIWDLPLLDSVLISFGGALVVLMLGALVKSIYNLIVFYRREREQERQREAEREQYLAEEGRGRERIEGLRRRAEQLGQETRTRDRGEREREASRRITPVEIAELTLLIQNQNKQLRRGLLVGT